MDLIPCPKCGSSHVKKVGYTWWGGAIGPRLMNHTKCNNCGTTYNGKSGKSNTNAIIIYNVVILSLCFFGLCVMTAVYMAVVNSAL
jgi:transposase-like protein